MPEYGLWERDWGGTTEKADWVGWDKEPIWFVIKFELFVLNSLDFAYIASLEIFGVPLLKSLDSWLITPSFDWILFPEKEDGGTILLVLSWILSEECTFWLEFPPKGTDGENCLGGPVSSTFELAGKYDCGVFTCGALEKLLILLGWKIKIISNCCYIMYLL